MFDPRPHAGCRLAPLLQQCRLGTVERKRVRRLTTRRASSLIECSTVNAEETTGQTRGDERAGESVRAVNVFDHRAPSR